ncbi:MAG: hypothetical protein J6C57_06460 [Paludibacteraceae bacterium]|nr:hypothetical protein [Paludibacteraceae bacterium]
MMTNLQSSAFVAKTTQLLSSVARLRLLLVMFLTLTVSAEVWAEEGTINFNNTAVKINAASVTGDDDLGNSWTITTVGTTSFTQQPTYSQVGSSSKPATSITFTTTLPQQVTITNFEAKFGGFNSTAGNITLKVGDTSVGTGKLNTTSDVTIQNTEEATGKILTVTVTNISKGVKAYYISYTYTTSGGDPDPDPVDPEVTFSVGEYTVGGAALDLSTLLTTNSTGAVTYSVKTDGGTGATINGTSFTATAAGTCTVQASIAATATHNVATATANITVTVPATVEGTWTLVTNAANLKAGDRIVIAAAEYDFALSTTQNTNNRGQASVTKNGNNITFTEATQILTLETGTVDNTLAFNTGNGYLYAASSGSNYLRTETTLSNNSSWAITIANDGTATIVAQGTNTRNTMQYNQSSSIFSCYGSASQKAIVIYKEVCTGGSTETLVSVLPKIMNFWQSIFGVSLGYLRDKTGYRHVLGGIVVVSLHHRCTKNRFSSYQYVKDRFRRIVPFRVANNRAFFCVSRGQTNDLCPRGCYFVSTNTSAATFCASDS